MRCVSVDRIYLVQERGQLVGTCEHSNELSGSVNHNKFLDLLKIC